MILKVSMLFGEFGINFVNLIIIILALDAINISNHPLNLYFVK